MAWLWKDKLAAASVWGFLGYWWLLATLLDSWSHTYKQGKYRVICAIHVFRRCYLIYVKTCIWKCLVDVFLDFTLILQVKEERFGAIQIHFFFLSKRLKSKGSRGFLRLARGGRVVIILLLPNSSQGKECFEDIFSCKCDVTSKLK